MEVLHYMFALSAKLNRGSVAAPMWLGKVSQLFAIVRVLSVSFVTLVQQMSGIVQCLDNSQHVQHLQHEGLKGIIREKAH